MTQHLPNSLTLRGGDIGDYVELVQRRLVELSLFEEGNISGEYDEATGSAIRHFQTLNNLEVDGVTGPSTARALKLTKDETASAPVDEEKKEAAQAAEASERELLAKQEAEARLAEQAAREEALAAETTQAHPDPLEMIEPEAAAQEADLEARPSVPTPPPNPFASKDKDVYREMKEGMDRQEFMDDTLQASTDAPTQNADAVPEKPAESKQVAAEAAHDKAGAEMRRNMLEQQEVAATPEKPIDVAAVPKEVPKEAAPQANDKEMRQAIEDQTEAMKETAASPPVPPSRDAQAAEQSQAQADQKANVMERAGGAKPIIIDAAVFERVAQQIEAKLEPETVKEVKATGKQMAQAGVSEAVLDREDLTRTVNTPAVERGTDQQMEIG